MVRQSLKRFFKYAAIFLICLVAASYAVPEFPEDPEMSHESIDELKLNAAGDTLLLRTSQYDYDFPLADRRLSEALAPLKHSTPIKPTDTPWYAHGTLSDPQIETDGSFRSRLTVTFIGYDDEIRPLDIGLPDKELTRLEKYGFTRVKNDYMEGFNATWSADLVGRRHDHNSLGAYTGQDLLTCCNDNLQVILDTQEKMEHNRRLNARLQPLTMVAQPVKRFVRDCAFLVYLLLGGKFALPGG